MAASRLQLPALRSLLGRQLGTFRSASQQRRWAQVHDVRFLATTQASHNITERYRSKLESKAREHGLQDIGALKEAYAGKIAEQRRKDNVSIPGLDKLLDDQPAPPAKDAQAQGHAAATAPRIPGQDKTASIKPLSDILDMHKARHLPVKELTAIWRLRHASKPLSLCAVIPSQTYLTLEAVARKHPTFVLPVPRAEQGAELHFLQWIFDAESNTSTVLFTQLAEYKARGEWAQPHTSVTHYRDERMEKEQGVVLMSGAVMEGRGASVDDARWLVMLLQKFYGTEGMAGEGGKRRLLEEFGRGDGRFSVERLLEESERLA